MYYFDPQGGRRRRALLRDKFAWLWDEVGDVREAAEGRAEDLRNRTKGVLHETRSAIGDVTGSDSMSTDGAAQTTQTTQTDQTSPRAA